MPKSMRDCFHLIAHVAHRRVDEDYIAVASEGLIARFREILASYNSVDVCPKVATKKEYPLRGALNRAAATSTGNQHRLRNFVSGLQRPRLICESCLLRDCSVEYKFGASFSFLPPPVMFFFGRLRRHLTCTQRQQQHHHHKTHRTPSWTDRFDEPQVRDE